MVEMSHSARSGSSSPGRVGRIHLWLMFGLAGLAIGFATFNRDKAYLVYDKPEWCGIYCVMAKDYTAKLTDQSFDRYYFRKSLGSALAHVVLKPVVPSISPQLANRTLEFISVAALIASVVLWFQIGAELALSATARWMGYAGLVLGQTTLKIVPSVQESPDTIALLVGLGALLAYLRRRSGWLLAIFVVAAFVQTQLQLALLPLVLFASIRQEDASARVGPRRWLSAAFAPLEAISSWLTDNSRRFGAMVLMAFLAALTLAGVVFPRIQKPFHGVANEISWLMPLSIPLAAAVMTAALVGIGLAAAIRGLPDVLRSVPGHRWLMIAGMYAVLATATAVFARGEIMSQSSTTLGSMWITYSFFYQAVEQPLKSIIAHLVYYGPIAGIILWRWRNLAKAVEERHDIGLTLSMAIMIALFVNSESRHLIAFLPWFAAFALVGLPRLGLLPIMLYAVFAGLASRLYADYIPVTPDADSFLMTWGPWWTTE